MFKKINRFSSLLEDNSSDYKKQLPRNNSRNNSRNNRRNYSNPSFGGKYESNDNKFINTVREEQKLKEIEESLLIDNFPSLVDKTSSSYNIIEENYTDKVNQVQVATSIKIDEILPGWVQLVKGGVYSNKSSTPSLKYKKDYIAIFNTLCINYEKWVNEYIEKWGEEEYEKIYLFPNYDYNQYDDSDSEDETSDDEEL
jgi:hypothetical protein